MALIFRHLSNSRKILVFRGRVREFGCGHADSLGCLRGNCHLGSMLWCPRIMSIYKGCVYLAGLDLSDSFLYRGEVEAGFGSWHFLADVLEHIIIFKKLFFDKTSNILIEEFGTNLFLHKYSILLPFRILSDILSFIRAFLNFFYLTLIAFYRNLLFSYVRNYLFDWLLVKCYILVGLLVGGFIGGLVGGLINFNGLVLLVYYGWNY
jgi:hypothetical protein